MCDPQRKGIITMSNQAQDQRDGGQDAEANDEFEAAFSEFADEAEAPREAQQEAASVENAGQQQETAAAAPDQGGGGAAGAAASGQEQAADDIWSSVPEPARAAWTAAQEQLGNMQRELHQYRSEVGRIGAFQQKYREMERQLAALQQGAAGEGAGKGQDAGAAEDDPLKDLRQDYPEIAGPVEKIIQQMQRETASLRERLAKVDAVEHRVHLDAQERQLSQAHPDWQQVADSPAFGAWLMNQPQYVRDVAYRNAQAIVSADEAADLIGRFKASQQAAPQGQERRSATGAAAKRQMQLDGARSAGGRTPVGVTNGPPDDFEAAFEHFAARGSAR